MKRVLIVSLLLPLMLAVSVRSMVLVDRVENTLLRMSQTILEASREEDGAKVAAEVEALCAYWDTEKTLLGHYVRHTLVEALGQSIARLPALTGRQSAADLASELLAIRWHIQNIKYSEAFAVRNIL